LGIIQQVEVSVAEAADGRRLGSEDKLAVEIVEIELVGVGAAGGIVVVGEKDLAVGVGVDGVAAAVGIAHDGLHVPAIEPGCVAAGSVAEGVGPQATA